MVNIMVQWILAASMAVLHPFFISVIEVSHNAKSATVEVSVRVFTDDLEKTLQKYTTAKIDLIQPKDRAFIDQQLNSYIGKTLRLKINGKLVIVKYLGYEIIKESIWSYFEIESIKAMNTLEVDCSLLYDFETNQVNIIHAKSKGLEKSYKLDYPQRMTSFGF
ncbi:MAG: hypothetical protein EAZ35_04440 [Sphingobacteriia bacterium]|nr:MAG: hypothetical protein EAZ35_04440 [Sphingobacteriia bacterium]